MQINCNIDIIVIDDPCMDYLDCTGYKVFVDEFFHVPYIERVHLHSSNHQDSEGEVWACALEVENDNYVDYLSYPIDKTEQHHIFLTVECAEKYIKEKYEGTTLE